METLSNILASFDIFQVILSAFPLIIDPIVHAFQQIFQTMYGYMKTLLSGHPGLTLGVIVFVTGYAGMSAFGFIRRYFTSSLRPAKQRSL